MPLPQAGSQVEALTYPSLEYDREAESVTGLLVTKLSPFEGPPQCWVNGVQVDPETVRPAGSFHEDFCGGKGGKPGPCGSGDDKTSGVLKALTIRVTAVVKQAAAAAYLDELPKWALEHVDVWTSEMSMNASQPGGVIAVKVAAAAAVKAWTALKAVWTGKLAEAPLTVQDMAERLHSFMSAVGAMVGYPAPSVQHLVTALSGQQEAQAFVEEFCGGKGSKVPGPCGKHDHKTLRAHANAAEHRLAQAQARHDRKPTEATAAALDKAQQEHANLDSQATAAEDAHSAGQEHQAAQTTAARRERMKQVWDKWRAEKLSREKSSGKVDSPVSASYHPSVGTKTPTQGNQMALPTLTGTEKQVAWANDLRTQRLAEIDAQIERAKVMAARYPKVAEHQQNLTALEHAREVLSGPFAAKAEDWIGMRVAQSDPKSPLIRGLNGVRPVAGQTPDLALAQNTGWLMHARHQQAQAAVAPATPAPTQEPTMPETKIQDVDAGEFQRLFSAGQPMTGDSSNPMYRAYRVIQDHMDYLKQMKAWKDSGENVEISPVLDENGTDDLVQSVGREKAGQIASHYGLSLFGQPATPAPTQEQTMSDPVKTLHDRLKGEIVAQHAATLAGGRQVAATSRTVAAHVQPIGKPAADGSIQADVTPLVRSTVGSHAPDGRLDILTNPQSERQVLSAGRAAELQANAETFAGQKLPAKLPLTTGQRVAALNPVLQGLKDRLGSVSGEYPAATPATPAPTPKPVTLTKTSSMRNVDAYRVGNVIRHEGQLMAISGYQRTPTDQGSYQHTLSLTPATPEQAKQARIAELEKDLVAHGSGPHNGPARDEHLAQAKSMRNELRSLKGQPSEDEEAAQQKAQETADFHKTWTTGTVSDRLGHMRDLASRPSMKQDMGSYADLGQASGLGTDRVYDLAKGVGAPPAHHELEKLAPLMGVTVDQLKHGTGEVPNLHA